MIRSRSRNNSWLARVAVTATAAGLFVLGGATTAVAEDDPAPADAKTPASATLKSEKGLTLVDAAGHKAPVATFTLNFGTEAAEAYCIDLHHGADIDGTYNEALWNKANGGSDLPKIQWILTHSVPNAAIGDLLAAAGITSTVESADLLGYVATQAAIWHFSDGFDLGQQADGEGAPTAEQYPVIKAVYDYLVGHAADEQEPGPSLSVSPQQATGAAGELVGPFTVSTTVDKLTVKGLNGAKVTDQQGKAISTLADGGKFWLSQDTPGTAEARLSGKSVVPTGRVFVSRTGPSKHQKMILAGAAHRSVHTKVSAEFTGGSGSPSPSPSESTEVPPTTAAPSVTPAGQGGGLPVTGSALLPIIGLAVLLLAGGTALLVMARRRRTS